MRLLRSAGLFLGVIAFIAVEAGLMPGGLSPAARHAAATAALMAVWWITEALPVAATALVPLALYPLLHVLAPDEVSRLYADPNIFLFMGGFMLALAMQKCGLHKRIALGVIVFIGGGLKRMLGGFMLATALLSMWVSNTATAVMMLPIGMAVIGRLGAGREESPGHREFSMALVLGIAYAASIGGVATLIGSPPNMIFAGQAKLLLPDLAPVGFVQWSLFGLPLAAGSLVLTWAYFCFFVMRDKSAPRHEREVLVHELKALGPVSPAEARVMLIFTLTVLAWVTRADVRIGEHLLRGWASALGVPKTHDGTVAMVAALLLFILPSGAAKGERLLNWEWAVKLPWDVLLLFGGGFALAESFQSTGLAAWLAGGFHSLQGIPTVWLVLLLCLATTFLSELMSNTAQVTLMMPILAAASTTLGVHPFLLMVPATFAASLAFMMPVGTPPNAIAFASGRVTMPQMAATGFWLNGLNGVWIVLVTLFLAGPVFGFRISL